MTKKCFLNEIKTIAEYSDIVDLIKEAKSFYSDTDPFEDDLITFMHEIAKLDITISLIASKIGIDDKRYMELVEDELAKRMRTINDKSIGSSEERKWKRLKPKRK